MALELLDTVVLTHDLPAHGLRGGDLGAIVEVFRGGRLQVEFVRPSGQTTALVTLNARDVRAVSGSDVLSVRTA
jgi:hypothetical protein